MAATSHIGPAVRQSRGGSSAVPERIFYDGHCGLCQGFVLFVIVRDRAGEKFRFAPLQGTTFQALVPENERAGLPDSIVILTNDGRLLIRSDGVLHVLCRMGGFWKFAAIMASVVPRPVRDAVYNFVARIRYRVFGKRVDVCPVMPPDLRARFDD